MLNYFYDNSAVSNLSVNAHQSELRKINYFADPMLRLKRAVWIYFFLLIFEGALRKWVFPGLATPLLIIRDPIALWLILVSWKRGLLRMNPFLFLMILIGIISTFTALFLGHGNFLVAAFGARILMIHFPLIFVIGRIFARADVIKLGKVCLWISIPMTVLITLQFYSPQSAWVNRGIGGDISGGGFDGALGYYRPPATFSFTNGTTLFYSFCAPFIFYFWLNRKNRSNLMVIAATISLLVAIPLSISRGLFFSVAVTSVFSIMAIFRKPKYIRGMLLICMGALVAIFFFNKTSFFETATQAFSSRFENANKAEGGVKGVLGDRYLGGMVAALTQSSGLPLFGYGIGMGTNVGGMLLTGKNVFLISEGEWGRLIGEMGTLLGLSAIFLRLGVCAKILIACYKKLVLGDLLPWMLLSFALLQIPQGQWAQPTSLGFSTIIGGIIIASCRFSSER
ncbi:hypothetical protein [Segetibacter koreensis]|uniref:hypothetical protein n=1 Tax=Segetibacter koreensis TaxID=398037 RepID=UPI000365C331|nr:hypothetical protein [Segetibacter koreensis]